MNEALGSIFISYRRDDTADVAGRIYDRLADHFGEASVFKDVDSIPLGADFRKVLSESVGRCAILVALIGREWLTITDASGRRRLDNPHDFVRIEIEAALQRDIPIIPLLVNGASMPSEETLPPSLQDLAYRNAAALRRDPDFRRDVARLTQALDAYLKQPQNEQSASAAQPQPSAPKPTSRPSAPSASSTSRKRTTQKAPMSPSAPDYLARGNARYGAQDYTGAIEEYTQAIMLDPKNAGAYNVRGLTYGQQNKLDLALEDFNQAITLDPTHGLAYYNRGLIYQQRKERDAAIADFRQARDLFHNPQSRQDAIDRLKELGAT
jgi:tetratricopeptide (TPR) repeat protein